MITQREARPWSELAVSPRRTTARARVPRAAWAAVERARLTVVPRGRPQARRVPFVILVSLVLLGGVVGLLVFNTQMQQASFAATAMEQRAAELTAREQQLQLELDALRDPQRVAVQARRLGMVPMSSPAFLRLSDGRVLGNPAPATPANAMRLTALPPRKPASIRAKVVRVRPPADDEAAVNAGRTPGTGTVAVAGRADGTGANGTPGRR